MKKNNWLHNKISQCPDYVLLGAVLILCLGYRWFYFGILHPNAISYNSDSVSYFTIVNIFEGVVDAYRTPLYIYVLDFFQNLSGDNFLRHLFLFQQTISFLSIIPFYYISKNLLRNRYLIIGVTIFYGCWFPIIIQNVNINPESLCIAGSTFVLYLFVKYIEKPAKYTAAAIGIFPFILIMLKPTYLILLGVIPVFLIVRFIHFRQERKILYWGLLGWLIAVFGVLGYCEMNNRYNGQFVLSKVTLSNSLDSVIESGAYKHGGDAEFITVIDATRQRSFYISQFLLDNDSINNYKRCYNRFPQYLPLTNDMRFISSLPDTVNYPYERLSRFVKKSQYSMTYFVYMFKRTIDFVWEYIILFLIIILESIIIVFAFVKYRRIAWTLSFCVLFVLGQFISIIIGGIGHNHLLMRIIGIGYYEYNRLLVPSYPCIIQITASFVGILISSLDKEKFIKSIL
ncbi:MAG: hypothetical protein NTW65_06325 [Deltaproteobacteria bacterium]|nr:hypothetical protein [Deltaproteobacteria bacterium]